MYEWERMAPVDTRMCGFHLFRIKNIKTSKRSMPRQDDEIYWVYLNEQVSQWLYIEVGWVCLTSIFAFRLHIFLLYPRMMVLPSSNSYFFFIFRTSCNLLKAFTFDPRKMKWKKSSTNLESAKLKYSKQYQFDSFVRAKKDFSFSFSICKRNLVN